jgi:hypothetical protein
MIKKIALVIQILCITTLISCGSGEKSTKTYFGGKIINPKSNQVVLFSMDKAIDTFLLDDHHKFIGEIKNAKEGLYYFVHGNENQHIYIEPKDSLMLRLNTWDFDESLVFAGKGAERNNILVDCFLEEEKDKKLFYDFNKLEPKDFKKKADSLLNVKLNTYNDYVLNHPKETDGFKDVLKVAITYPVYSRIERYPIIYAKYSEEGNFPNTSEDFYAFRENIDINKESMIYFPPYSKYIRNYVYNETYSLGYAPMKRNYSSKFTLDLLNVIDNKIEASKTKNAFLKQTLISHFYNKSSDNLNLEAFEIFLKSSTNKEDKTQIQNLLNDSKVISLGKDLPSFDITDYTDADHSVHHVIKNKNAFLLFWNPKYVSKNYLASRINYLSNNYPNIVFHIIKTDGNNDNNIEQLDIKHQFYIDEDNLAQTFLSSKMTRAILINKKGEVVNGFASIYSNNLIPYLEELNKFK